VAGRNVVKATSQSDPKKRCFPRFSDLCPMYSNGLSMFVYLGLYLEKNIQI
jgi:hypothetical protein